MLPPAPGKIPADAHDHYAVVNAETNTENEVQSRIVKCNTAAPSVC